jgi:hypothetical protein
MTLFLFLFREEGIERIRCDGCLSVHIVVNKRKRQRKDSIDLCISFSWAVSHVDLTRACLIVLCILGRTWLHLPLRVFPF